MPKTVAVTGATGAQGAAIAAAFADRGYDVRGVSRRGAAAADLTDAAALERAFAGAAVVAFTVPLDHRPGARERMAEAVAAAADRAGVGRLVLNTAGPVFAGYDRPVAAVLRRVREAVRAGRVPAVVVQPTVYMDNLRAPWALPGIAGGTFAYPMPPDVPASWLSHRSLGQFVVAAAEVGQVGRVYDVGGPSAVTGPQIAELIAAEAGRPVSYVPIPLDGFAAGLNQVYGPPAGDDIADLYRYVADHPAALVRDPAGAADLGVEPEGFAAFVGRHDWSPPAAG